MYINFWYAAERTERLTNKPLRVRMLGQDFVLVRDSTGRAICLANTCIHRGGSLANGKLRGDCIACPYHGWEFDRDGQCRRIPSLGANAKIPGRARIDSYPVTESYGLVHVFLGDLPDSERPPVMEIPEFGQPGWYASWNESVSELDYRRTIENGLDPAHNEFVHTTHGFAGNPDDHCVPNLKVEERAWGSGFITTYYSPPLADERMRTASGRAADAQVEAGTFHHGPTCMTTYIRPTATIAINQNVFKTPIDAHSSRTFLVQMRNFLQGPEHDARFHERNAVVRDQDLAVLRELKPFMTPETNSHELLVPSDEGVTRYREFLREWEARGWRIDEQSAAVRGRREALVIPSPARRVNPRGWVLDTVPLLPGGSQVSGIARHHQ